MNMYYVHSTQELKIEDTTQKHRDDDLYSMLIESRLDESISWMTPFLHIVGGLLKKNIFELELVADEGGPRREFFMLLMKAIANLSGWRVLRHNTGAVQVIPSSKRCLQISGC